MEKIYGRDKTTSPYSTRKNSSPKQKLVIENVEKKFNKAHGKQLGGVPLETKMATI